MKEFYIAAEVHGLIEAETEREARAAVADAANRMAEHSRPKFHVTGIAVSLIKKTDELIEADNTKGTTYRGRTEGTADTTETILR